jgi:hypothetical protein
VFDFPLITRYLAEVHDTVSMSWAMLNTMSGFYDWMHLDRAAVTARTIVVDTCKVRAIDFNPDRNSQDVLFRMGREAALKFLDGARPGSRPWDWEAFTHMHKSSASWAGRMTAWSFIPSGRWNPPRDEVGWCPGS